MGTYFMAKCPHCNQISDIVTVGDKFDRCDICGEEFYIKDLTLLQSFDWGAVLVFIVFPLSLWLIFLIS